MLEIGQPVPDVTLPNDHGKQVQVKEAFAKGGHILFTYPKADTPGCNKQSCGFRDSYEKLQKLGYHVWGASFDPPNAQAAWKAKNNFQYTLFSDEDQKLGQAVGFVGDSGMARRCHFIFRDG
ncbi:peroxiredoxin Q, partial [Caulochytrium protostelioides]